jgi:hypothetical protein
VCFDSAQHDEEDETVSRPNSTTHVILSEGRRQPSEVEGSLPHPSRLSPALLKSFAVIIFARIMAAAQSDWLILLKDSQARSRRG